MPPSSLGAAAAVLALILWWLGRRPPTVVLRSTDASAVAALNRAQLNEPAPADSELAIAEVSAGSGGPSSSGSDIGRPSLLAWQPPGPGRRHSVLIGLRRRFRGDNAARLEVMRAARLWGDRCVLGLLRQGLRDPDPAVMREAALGLERFRGRTTSASVPPQAAVPPLPLPRNVARSL
jgi:hypothetical protein